MINCSNCIFYDKNYDELLRSGDDTIKINDNYPDKHYCRIWDGLMPKGIFTNEVKCRFVAPK